MKAVVSGRRGRDLPMRKWTQGIKDTLRIRLHQARQMQPVRSLWGGLLRERLSVRHLIHEVTTRLGLFKDPGKNLTQQN